MSMCAEATDNHGPALVTAVRICCLGVRQRGMSQFRRANCTIMKQYIAAARTGHPAQAEFIPRDAEGEPYPAASFPRSMGKTETSAYRLSRHKCRPAVNTGTNEEDECHANRRRSTKHQQRASSAREERKILHRRSAISKSHASPTISTKHAGGVTGGSWTTGSTRNNNFRSALSVER